MTTKIKTPSDLYCDTSIVYYRLHGHSVHKAAVRTEDSYFLGEFAIGEYVRGYIKGLLRLYFAIKNENDVTDGLISFNAAEHSPRAIGNALIATTGWLCGHEDWQSVDKTLVRLGEYVRACLRNIDYEFPRQVSDEIKCEFGSLRIPGGVPFSHDLILDLQQRIKAIEESPACRQCEFRSAMRKRLEEIGVDITSTEANEKYSGPDHKGFAKQVKWIAKADKSNKTSPSCWYCQRLSDAIIALSTPEGHVVATGDAQSFVALCELLGKEIRIIDAVK